MNTFQVHGYGAEPSGHGFVGNMEAGAYTRSLFSST